MKATGKSVKAGGISRREFIKVSAAAGAAALVTSLDLGTNFAFAAGSDAIKVGLIGCGSGGLRAARDCIRSANGKGVQVVALADAFSDRVSALRGEFNVRRSRCFSGLDSWRDVLDLNEVNLVILAPPPAFRPVQFAQAVERGKHVFVEAPVAICPAGVKMVTEAANKAREKSLTVVVGASRRHDPAYVETMKRIHDGAIGRILTAQCYWNQGGMYVYRRKIGESDVEWQLRNWRYFTWLSGDLIVERHVHNLDVINWALRATPDSVHGLGGRQYRTGPEYGNVFDHFGTEFFYPGDVHFISMCRQIEGTNERIGERVVGTKGASNCRGRIEGKNAWRYRGRAANPFVREHADLVKSIRAGAAINEGQQAADSALTAIMARESAYARTNFKQSWFVARCTLNRLPPRDLKLSDAKPVEPVAVPGKYVLPVRRKPQRRKKR